MYTNSQRRLYRYFVRYTQATYISTEAAGMSRKWYLVLQIIPSGFIYCGSLKGVSGFRCLCIQYLPVTRHAFRWSWNRPTVSLFPMIRRSRVVCKNGPNKQQACTTFFNITRKNKRHYICCAITPRIVIIVLWINNLEIIRFSYKPRWLSFISLLLSAIDVSGNHTGTFWLELC